MNHIAQFDARSALHHVPVAIEEYHGGCDPEFDNDLHELERQFAEFRLMLPSQ